MPPLEPPTGDGPETLAVRTMSGREPGRVNARLNAIIFVVVLIMCQYFVL